MCGLWVIDDLCILSLSIRDCSGFKCRLIGLVNTGYEASSRDGHIVAFGPTFVRHMLGREALRMRDRGRPEDWVHSLLHHMMIEARAAFHRPCHASWCLAYKDSQTCTI